ncbi:MAG: CDP-glucose 4,6-dehydratase [Gammaproteobacteria bacterium]|nr:MAG: CDP-glucose 4,6-dehydratase [Gammaproteobacteria bacterium]
MKPNFWQGKKVFITGHTGFKGSWLSLWLQSVGANVIGYAQKPPTTPSLFEVAKVAEGMTSIIGDVRDLEHLQTIIAQHKPEIIFHLAAQPLVRYSYANPVETYATNVMGTVHLLEAVRQVDRVKVVVNITSDKCYENQEWLWGYRENEPMGGYDPYSNSKGCAELVTSAYRQSFFSSKDGVALASVRAGNVIGGGDWAEDRLIPDIMQAIMTKKPVIIRNPKAIRPWQHVLEPLHGYLMLAEKLWENSAAYAQAWNFGPNEEDAKPVQWIVERLTQMWSNNASWKLDNKQHPHEAHYLKLDCAKAKTNLGWYPKWTLKTALENIIYWYQAYEKQQDMQQITIKQIEGYQKNIIGRLLETSGFITELLNDPAEDVWNDL